MFRNYFKTAWRNLLKNKFYSVINITGLAIGLAVGIMILLWVQDETSFDTFHTNAAHIYKVNSHLGNANAQVWGVAPAPLTVFAKESVPDVVNGVRVMRRWNNLIIQTGNDKLYENTTAYADSGFFSLFSFPLLQGNPDKPFTDMHSVVLTASTAKKLFGTEQAVGKTLQINKEHTVVSAVMQDFPGNSVMQYNMIFPMTLYARNFTEAGGNGDWKTIDADLGGYNYDIYFQLRPQATPEAVAKKITSIFYQHKSGEDADGSHFVLQPLTSLHLETPDGNKGAQQTARIFLLVAALILIIACINYVNLSTARSMQRAKEVSMRKIAGAARQQLFAQFIVESALLFLFATLLAFGIIYLLLPLYNDLSGKNLRFNLLSANVWLVTGGAILGTLLLSGIYPALLLSSFRPLQALKGKLTAGIATTTFRKTLVVTQFVFSTALIISTVVIASQLQYMRSKNLGFNKEQVFTFRLDKATFPHFDVLRNKLAQMPGVLGITCSGSGLAGINGTTGDTDWEGKAPNSSMMIHEREVDENFIPLLQMQMVAGRNFTGEGDSARYILNETAIRQMGIKDPIGKRFSLHENKGIITGVVKDYNYSSLRTAVEPIIMYYSRQNYHIYVKTTTQAAEAVIAAAKKNWEAYGSDFPFSYSFLDADFEKMYRADQRAGNLFKVFAVVTIFISALGLLGLATYTAQVKTKEMGIRKVLGASVPHITSLMAREFVQLVVLAFIIATPLAAIAMYKWLQNYTYRIQLQWWMFALTGVAAVAIALLTVAHQAIKTAIANPVNSLKAE
ncbi:putative ABC transport system permease protein [Filimonas zeae]|uniref:ABC transporter permease n=1 Tax=Filimonas zeae TaxID=1737353 RepID=A0A917MVR9_9BACT|nr:ABC transporter permease [Filimonas zeae]MDR6338792.1 putative ABC transport system permease protein [Filimonas zeae]GGH66590.1 ABC transporter permease [Filimonas zeae]